MVGRVAATAINNNSSNNIAINNTNTNNNNKLTIKYISYTLSCLRACLYAFNTSPLVTSVRNYKQYSWNSIWS